MRLSGLFAPVLAVALAGCASCGDDRGAGIEPRAAPTSEASAAPVGSEGSPATATTADEGPAAADAPLVDLAGESRPPAAPPSEGPRLAARAMLVAIHERPDEASRKIGWLRAGAIVGLREREPAGRAGCPGGFHAILPRGFVCVGDKATLDLEDPIVRATARRPDPTQKLPYMYGTVTRGGPVYGRLPTEEETAELEPSLKKHIAKWKDDDESGATYGLDVWAKWSRDPLPAAIEAWDERTSDPDERVPFYLRGGGPVPDLSGRAKKGSLKIDQIDRRQGIAFIDTFLRDGRRWNVATDLRLVPADRLRPIRGSEHRGVRIGVDVELPFALVRRPGGKRMGFEGKKKLVAKADLPYRAAINLTGKQTFIDEVLHFETKEGDWISDRYASRIDPAKKMPKWGKNGERWLDVNITKQVLVAYEGEKPVFATIVSTGEAGLADHEGSTATKKGIFRIHTKFVTTTMDSDAAGEEFELRDVPYVQYFEDGYALHGAYWHDRFGQPKSHGCINLAPEDARRLFHFTEPQVPDAWHGAAKPLTGTVVFIHP